jgi:mono/diheme cytochrome c family protein/uncharacterized membrane protein
MASLAEVGHAVAAAGTQRSIHVAADALHLVAAGAWLGALVPFAIALRATSQPTELHALARRFSVVGIAGIVLLIASGVVNAVYLVASWPALFGTAYGQLLVAKIALFAAMLVLAAWNLLRETPRLAYGDATPAAARIARNARAEAAFGVGLLAIVGVLGVAVPAAHDEIRWPFGFRIAFDGGLPSIIAAHPTTYVHPPRYTVSSIARGSAVYAAHCAACHDTGAAPTLRAAHVLAHRPGDVYWWIAHGIERTSMPAFDDKLAERARWDVVQFARTLASASTLHESTTPLAIVAPEFTYQIDRRPQQLVGLNAPAATLLVLYTMPDSRDRLSTLAASLPELARAGIRVAAVAMRADDTDPSLANIAATASPAIVDVYRLFAPDVAHVEFLIDPGGRLRARWLPGALAEPAQIARQFRSLPATPAAPIVHEHDR